MSKENYDKFDGDIVKIAKQVRKDLKREFGETAKFSVRTKRAKNDSYKDGLFIIVLDAYSEHLYSSVEEQLDDGWVHMGFEDFNRNYYTTSEFHEKVLEIFDKYNNDMSGGYYGRWSINREIPK